VPRPLQYRSLLQTLNEHAIDYIVVGGVGAALHGASISTLDLDVVYSVEADNLKRLVSALEELDAVYRAEPDRNLMPKVAHLAAGGHNLLITRFGPLDVLGSVGNGRTYQDLGPHSTPTDLGGGLVVPILDLETLIAIKEEVGGEKDLAVLPILRRTLEESRRR
jgi:hypothetical protein